MKMMPIAMISRVIIYHIFIAVFLSSITQAVERIVLVGDSIIDNPYWNDVGADTTGEKLLEMLNGSSEISSMNREKVLVDDRSTDEACASDIVRALQWKTNMRVKGCYVDKRNDLKIGYVSEDSASVRLPQYASINSDGDAEVNISSDIKGSYVFISAGGNDLLLKKENPSVIVENIKAIGSFYKKSGAKKVNYIIPYTMSREIGFFWSIAINVGRHIIKEYCIKPLKGDYYDDIIDLSDFDDSHRKAHYMIPEPTKKGAEELARRIADKYKEQIVVP